jgi:nicotinamidase-related amidase
LAPEVKKILGRSIAQFNTQFFETLTNNDRLYIWGEAKSHCVMWTIKDLLRNLQATDPAMINKVYILEDCMSPVAAVPGADFPAIAEQTMEEFRAAGMNIVKSTDPVIIEQRANIY